ncbi:accessory Sec system glycosylation chaperone GtfB, partial [Staphylococcus epidermidis]
EYLVTKHTEYQFHVAAITEMSSRLMNLGDYPNVKLYPAIKQNMVNQLYEYCDIYLDINEGGEILNAVRKAFDHHMLILG